MTGESAVHAEVPARTYVGQTLEVPEADLERGQIFYVLPGADTQLTITSAAPLRRSVLTTSRAVGYVVATFDPEDSDRPILGGALRVPAVSFESGSPSVDRTFHGAGFFESATHPELTFELTGTGNAEKLASGDEDVFPYRVKLHGKLTARGVTQDVEMDAEVRFFLTSFTTFTRFPGDLMTIAGSFDVEPSAFGWEMPQGAAALVAPKLAVDVFLVGSTMSPEKNLDPDADLERWRAGERYLTLVRDLGNREAAAEHGAAYFEKYRDDAEALAALAQAILDEPGLEPRDLALARRLAERAAELDGGDAGAEIMSRLNALCGAPAASTE